MSMLPRACFVLPSAYGYFSDSVEGVGGGARQLSFISRELANRLDMHFVVGDYGQPETEYVDGVTLHRAYTPKPGKSGLARIGDFLKLLRAMRAADADIYLYRGRPKLAGATFLATRILDRDWVYNIANDPNVESTNRPILIQYLFNYALDHATAIIAQTDHQAQIVREKFGYETTVIPSGYPPAEETAPHDEREFFLWVGRLDEEQKRPHRFLDVAERVPEADFVLVGPGGEDESYNRRISDRAESLANVTFVGWVPPDEVHDYYRDAMALLNTSAAEGFPSTFIEAWRYDTPVLSLSIDQSRYVDSETPIRGFADDDLETLITDVRTILTDTMARRRYSRPTHEYFEANLTIEQIVDRYLNVLRGT